MYEPDRTIDIGPVTLAVDDRGSGSATPLVLMHGFTGGRIDFEDVIDDLATDRRVVAWDHRGHSDSTNTGDAATYTFERLVDDAVAAADALDLDRFHLLGHSMGGIVAQQFVLAHPDRVESLILMDTLAESAPLLPQEAIDNVVAIGRDQGMAAVADLMAKSAPASVALEADRPRIAARNRYKLINMDVEAFGALAGALRTFPPLLPRLGTDHVPDDRDRRRGRHRVARPVRLDRRGRPRRHARRDRRRRALPAGRTSRRLARHRPRPPRPRLTLPHPTPPALPRPSRSDVVAGRQWRYIAIARSCPREAMSLWGASGTTSPSLGRVKARSGGEEGVDVGPVGGGERPSGGGDVGDDLGRCGRAGDHRGDQWVRRVPAERQVEQRVTA